MRQKKRADSDDYVYCLRKIVGRETGSAGLRLLRLECGHLMIDLDQKRAARCFECPKKSPSPS